MAKKNDKRVDEFRDKAMGFVADHFSDMDTAFKFYVEKQQWDKAVALYMKMADKVIPALATQTAETQNEEVPAWKQKVDKAKRTIENDTK